MREIIVGRQLARVEQRLDRLEHFVEQPALPQQDTIHRIEHLEAQFEAARDHVQHQVDQIRLEFGGEIANRKSEVHRLAEQIQQAAQARLQANAAGDVEQRVGSWLGQWQKSLENHLEQRENWLIQQLRAELQQLRQHMNQQWQQWNAQNHQQSQVHQAKIQQIADAARALAESAASLGALTNPDSPQPPL